MDRPITDYDHGFEMPRVVERPYTNTRVQSEVPAYGFVYSDVAPDGRNVTVITTHTGSAASLWEAEAFCKRAVENTARKSERNW